MEGPMGAIQQHVALRVQHLIVLTKGGDGRWPNLCKYTPIGKCPIKNSPTRTAINHEGMACIHPRLVWMIDSSVSSKSVPLMLCSCDLT